ncbi:hypothetical protein [Rhodococcus opacus]|uniref:hypothetical protein n=1 Tax=Rhodococcus opacus TaxID=37919 RepID=UPI00280AF7AF|nr:hypothetical protein [Rhodococcus opacus]
MSWWDTIGNGAMCGGSFGTNLGACKDAAGAAAGQAADAAAAPAVAAADGVFEKFAAWVGQAAGDLLVSSMTWWLSTDSINIDSGKVLAGERPIQLLVTFILMAGVFCTAILMSLTRRGKPLVDMLTGAAKYVIIQSLALVVLSQALAWGDVAAATLVADGAENFGPKVSELLGLQAISNPAMLALVAMVCWFLSLVQWVFGFLRQGGIVVLAAMISIAAAGQLFPWGRQWFPRIASMLVALVLYKPMAAIIYTLGFKLMGEAGTENVLESVMVGAMVLVIAVISLPGMMAFFAWVGTPSSPGVSSAATAAELGAVGVGGADLMSKMNSWGGAGGEAMTGGSDPLASYMQNTGPGSGPNDVDPGPGAHNLPDPQPWETPGGAAPDAGAPGSGTAPGMENPAASDQLGPHGAPAAGTGAQDAENVGSAAGSGGTAAATGTEAAAGAATGGVAVAAKEGAAAVGEAAQRVGEAANAGAQAMTGSDPDQN